MSQRSELEDRYRVACARCGRTEIDPTRRPGQKYILDKACSDCGHVRRRRSGYDPEAADAAVSAYVRRFSGGI
jgi:uncharacterized Zn finger protein